MRIDYYQKRYHILLIVIILVTSWACIFLGSTIGDQKYGIPDNRDLFLVDHYRSPNLRIVQDTEYGSNCYIFNRDYSDMNPAWSPDGKQIAFLSDMDGDNDIYVIDADGSNCRNLTADPSPLLTSILYMIRKTNDGWPAWSPDGKLIAFGSARDNIMMNSVDMNVYLMEPDGSHVINLTYTGDDEALPSWAPDGERLVLIQKQGKEANILTIHVDGSQALQLTESNQENSYPRWSPNGNQIVFESNRDGDYDIYVMNTDGSEVIPLTKHPHDDRRPVWSPNGDQIAFASNRDGDAEIYIMNSDGSNIIQVTNNELGDSDPSWSPDGNSITYHSNVFGDSWRIFRMDVDGSNQKQLTGNSTEESHLENAIYHLQKGTFLFYSILDSSEGSLDSVIESLSNAINLDQGLGEAYLARGLAYLYRCDFRWTHVIRTEIKISKRNNECSDYSLAVSDLERALDLGLAPGVVPGAQNFLNQLKK